MGSRGNTWDAAADRKLLLSVLKTQNVSIDYEAVAKDMSTNGQVYTVSAIQNRMQRLKTMVKDKSTEGNDTVPKGKTAGRKRGATAAAEGETASKKGRVSKGKGGKAKAIDADDEAGEDDYEEGEENVKQEEASEDELV